MGGFMKERSAFKPPKWIRRLPKDIRKAVEQEYYVNPDQAKTFAAAGSMEGIRKLRQKRWDEETSFHSSLLAEGEVVISGETREVDPI
jgi:hypothetical protein